MADLAALAREREARRGVPQRPQRRVLPPLPVHRIPASYLAIATVAAVLIAQFMYHTDPLANGAVPASARTPDQHWEFIRKNPSFIRDMVASARKPFWKRLLQINTMREEIEQADYGGEDGHEAEGMDDGVGAAGYVGTRDLSMLVETMRVTRCTTTQSALTAYFCGSAVQHNQDTNADAGGPKGSYGGHGPEAIDGFSTILAAYHARGEAEGTHERHVYRLGIGSEDGKAGYAHVWNVVALPTGRFYWLQSFIGHYSLATWMDTLAKGEPDAVAGMSFEALQAKLDLLKTLFAFRKWDTETNRAYKELFNVDMAAARSKRDAMAKEESVHTQRLGSFSWDLACAYPTPDEPVAAADPMSKLAEFENNWGELDSEMTLSRQYFLVFEMKLRLFEFEHWAQPPRSITDSKVYV